MELKTDGTVYCLKDHGDYLYIGGSFARAGEVDTGGVAKFNKTTFETTAMNLSNGVVYSIEFDASDNIYIGGEGFISNKQFRKWNAGNSTWESVGDYVFNGTVSVLKYDSTDDNMYIGGSFLDIDGSESFKFIAKYDISDQVLVDLRTGYTNQIASSVNAIESMTFGGTTYAIICFGTTDKIVCHNNSLTTYIRLVDISGVESTYTTSDVISTQINGNEINGTVYSALYDASYIYYGCYNTDYTNSENIVNHRSFGCFSVVDVSYNSHSNILDTLMFGRFDVGLGLTNNNSKGLLNGYSESHLTSVLSIKKVGSRIYLGGNFTKQISYNDSSTNNVNNLAYIDISDVSANTITFKSVGNGVSRIVYALEPDSSDNLYIGGRHQFVLGDVSFNSLNLQTSKNLECNIARVNIANNVFNALSTDIIGLTNKPASGDIPSFAQVYCALYDSSRNCVFMGGNFEALNDSNEDASTVVYNVCKYDISSGQFSAYGSGFNGHVYTLALDSTFTLFAGGQFTKLKDVSETELFRLAKYDTTDWVTAGMFIDVSDTTVGSTCANTITFGPSTRMVVGGDFDYVKLGDDVVQYYNCIAWDYITTPFSASSISPMLYDVSSIVGFNNIVHSVAYDDASGCVYVGGQYSGFVNDNFTTNTTQNIQYFSKLTYDVSYTLTSVTPLLDHYVYTVTPKNPKIYCGGVFTSDLSSTSLNKIGYYDISSNSWSAIDLSINSMNDIYDGVAGWISNAIPGQEVSVKSIVANNNGDLYVGGYIEERNRRFNGIAIYDSTNKRWKRVKDGVPGVVNSVAFDTSNNMLYIGGKFSSPNNFVKCRNIAVLRSDGTFGTHRFDTISQTSDVSLSTYLGDTLSMSTNLSTTSRADARYYLRNSINRFTGASSNIVSADVSAIDISNIFQTNGYTANTGDIHAVLMDYNTDLSYNPSIGEVMYVNLFKGDKVRFKFDATNFMTTRILDTSLNIQTNYYDNGDYIDIGTMTTGGEPNAYLRSTNMMTPVVLEFTTACLLHDTNILTPNGYIKVQFLKKGDFVVTSDNRTVEIKDVFCKNVVGTKHTYPYKIPKNSIDENYPSEDVMISPIHLIKVANTDDKWIMPMKFKGFCQDTTMNQFIYYHIQLENFTTDHLVISGGLIVESKTNDSLSDKLEWKTRLTKLLTKKQLALMNISTHKSSKKMIKKYVN